MTPAVLGHQGEQLRPHDLWSSWQPDPLVAAALVVGGLLYLWGWTRPHPHRPAWRGRCAALGFLAVALAVLTPLDTLSASLASAHMVQHVVLVLVAAPLLALGAPVATMLRPFPLTLRRRLRRTMRSAGVERAGQAVRLPVVAWLLHAGVIWIWHSATLYDAAVREPLVHGLEHAAFLGTGVLFWSAPIGISAVSSGAGVLLVFTMALQSVFLSALLTFAPEPWYDAYATTTAAWGLDQLADQQLAGVIMWVPAGFIYVGAALALLARWIHDADRAGNAPAPAPPSVRPAG